MTADESPPDHRPAPGVPAPGEPVGTVVHVPDASPAIDESTEERAVRARRLLQEAIAKGRPEAPTKAAGVKVDKYFGTDLPPVCQSLGCYVTDDGKRFYCINHACQKHKKRATKHSRKGNPLKAPNLVYFRCPRCDARRIDMHLMSNQYVCRSCRHVWSR